MAESKKPNSDDQKKNKNAVALGRLGGLVGGKARAAALSPAQRKSIASKGGEAKRDGRVSGAGNVSGMTKKKADKKNDK